jgi:glycosyltransferase involved in cell wall biosynthesis
LFREIEQRGMSLTGRTHVVPNWIDVPLQFARESYYTPGKMLRICFSGSIGPSKGVDYLIEGLKLIAESGSLDGVLEIDLFGQGDTAHYEERCMAAGLSNVVRFRGAVTRSSLIELFSEYDLMLFPTWAREPFAFAPMEAASRGCVQAFSDDCGNAEWFFHGVDCLKFRRSAAGVAGLISDILGGAYSFRELVENQASSLRMHFRLEVVCKTVESILIEASSRKRAPARSAEWSRQFGILAENVAINLGAI